MLLDNVIKDLSLILQIRREVNEQKTTIHFSEIIKEIQLSIDNLIQLEKVEFKLDFSEDDTPPPSTPQDLVEVE